MWVHERDFATTPPANGNWLSGLLDAAREASTPDDLLLRAVVSSSDESHIRGEALILSGVTGCGLNPSRDCFRFQRRPYHNTSAFNAVVMVPTGVGAQIGGHAGDAGPLVRLAASVCDHVVTHPNVVNGSDINELPDNASYVEGSVLTRLLLGNIALQPVRQNRVLVVIDDHPDTRFSNAAINAVNAARATYGLICPQIVKLAAPARLKVKFSRSGRAAGEVANLDVLVRHLWPMRGAFDAVAVSSVIDAPAGCEQAYFASSGDMVNPWGGVEAMLTHALSTLFNVPTAHAPMTREVADAEPGVVDPRMAAEAVSLTFLQSVLKGLQRSPRILPDARLGADGLLDVTRISCLVIPDGCLGAATLAALAQDIPVIAVRENASIMKNDLMRAPWRAGQLHVVDNYWEAMGVLAALKAGLAPEAVRRPLAQTPVSLAKSVTACAKADLEQISL